MSTTAIIIIVCIGLPIICGTIIAIVSITRGKSEGLMGGDDEEAKLVQDLHQGITRLEKRIESLETILFEKEKHRTHKSES